MRACGGYSPRRQPELTKGGQSPAGGIDLGGRPPLRGEIALCSAGTKSGEEEAIQAQPANPPQLVWGRFINRGGGIPFSVAERR